jgi:hypothetical protein
MLKAQAIEPQTTLGLNSTSAVYQWDSGQDRKLQQEISMCCIELGNWYQSG